MKRVLITGASGGIGNALVHCLAASGYTVFAAARDPSKIAKVESATAAAVHYLSLNISDLGSVQQAVAKIEQLGGVDVLVNNAGYGQMGALIDMPIETLQQQFEVNLFAQLRLTQAVAKGMIERRRGRIVNIGSVSGITATPFAGAYCASKAAFHLMSDSLRMELAPFGVEVVIVQPGAIRSSFGDNAAAELALGSHGSVYASVEAGARQRAGESQNDKSTPASEFAQEFQRKVLADKCATVIRIGSGSRALPALKRWLPDRILDKVMNRRFGLNQLK